MLLQATQKRSSLGGCPSGIQCASYNSSDAECKEVEQDIDSDKVTLAWTMKLAATDRSSRNEMIRSPEHWSDDRDGDIKVKLKDGKLVLLVKGNSPERQEFTHTFIVGRSYDVAISYDASDGKDEVKLYVEGELKQRKDYSTTVNAKVEKGKLGCTKSNSEEFQGEILNFYALAMTFENDSGDHPAARRRRTSGSGGGGGQNGTQSGGQNGSQNGAANSSSNSSVNGTDQHAIFVPPPPTPAPVAPPPPTPAPAPTPAPPGPSTMTSAELARTVRTNWCNPWKEGASTSVPDGEDTTGVSYFTNPWEGKRMDAQDCWDKCAGDDTCEQAVYKTSTAECWLGVDTVPTDPGAQGFPVAQGKTDADELCFAKNGFGFSRANLFRPGFCGNFTEGYDAGGSKRDCNPSDHEQRDMLECSHWPPTFGLSAQGCYAKCISRPACQQAVYSAKTKDCSIGISLNTVDPGDAGFPHFPADGQDSCYAKQGFGNKTVETAIVDTVETEAR